MNDIYQWIIQESNRFETDEVQVGENWMWNFRNHTQIIFHLKHGIFFKGENDYTRAFKLIMKPLLRLSYWTEDLEVKDVVFYIESSNGRVLSFLIKKYHDEVYVKEHDLDTLFDNITESDIDYGGALVQKKGDGYEVVPLTTIAFCDQTDLLGGAVGFRFYFSPDKLREMSKYGWGETKNGATIDLEDLILLASEDKTAFGTQAAKSNQTPSKNIEVYVVHGNLKESWLKDDGDEEKSFNQIQIVGFYTDKKGNKQGVTLYRQKAEEGNLKFHSSEKIPGRALGYSDGEAFLQPQIWSNFLEIHKMQMLASGAKTPLVTDDPTFTNKNKIQDMENLEVTTIEQGRSINFIPTISANNVQLYTNSIDTWFNHAQLLGSAFDPILGQQQSSGTTFRGQERTVAQGRGWHDRRRGQRAKFIEKLYRDKQGIITDMVKEIADGKKFMATLSGEELRWVADNLSENEADNRIKQAMLDGKTPIESDREVLAEVIKSEILSAGNKHLVEILKDEFRDVEVKIGINVAGKQKDLAVLSDKVLSIFQFIFANPPAFQQAMQIPALANAFQDILEFGGLNQASFSSLLTSISPSVPSVTSSPPMEPQPTSV